MAEQTRPISILLVDDDPDYLSLAADSLDRRFEEFDVESTEDARDALDRLKANGFDCVVTDYRMPEIDGLEFLEEVREMDDDFPVIFFTGAGSEEVASKAISVGVTDYVQKNVENQFLVLGNRVKTLVSRHRAVEEARRANERARQVYERITEAFFALDSQWRFVYLNSHAADLFGHSQSELQGKEIWTAFPRLANSDFETTLRRSFDSQESMSFETHAGPFDAWLAVVTYPSDEGISLFLRDISDIKEAEEELDQLRRVLELTESKFDSLQQRISRPEPPFR